MVSCIRALIPLMGLPWWLRDKNPPAKAGDEGSIPGSGRPPEEEMATHPSVLAWRIPRTEEPGGLHFMEVSESQTWLSNYMKQQIPFMRPPPSGPKHLPKSLPSTTITLGSRIPTWTSDCGSGLLNHTEQKRNFPRGAAI